MTNKSWQSSATISVLQQRAKILAEIRQFFALGGVLEVETPLLCRAGSTDPFLESWQCAATEDVQKKYYLQTSPEYAMKRLLASGSGSIYQMAKVFRAEEQGRYHNPEFTLLEWYRVDWPYLKLMDEVAALLKLFLPEKSIQILNYRDLFLKYLSLDPWKVSWLELKQVALQSNLDLPAGVDETDVDVWLIWLMATLIEPRLPQEAIVFVKDYPASQAVLAQTREESYGCVAERFEVYVQGLELANGFQELQDPWVQRQRFEADNAKRKRLGLAQMPLDESLIAALQAGLPFCAGVALGIDRLVLLALEKNDLTEVLSFSFARV